MGNGDQERLGALAGKQASAGVAERGGHHNRDIASAGGHGVLGGEEGRLAVQRVEYGLDQEKVGARVQHGLHGRAVGVGEFIERDVPGGRILDVRRHPGGAAGGADASRDEARPGGITGGKLVGHLAGIPRPGESQVVHTVLQAVVKLGKEVRVERVGLYDVRSGLKIGAVHGLHQVGTRDVQDIVVAGQGDRMRREFTAVEIPGGRVSGLEHRAHGAVQDQDSFSGERSDFP